MEVMQQQTRPGHPNPMKGKKLPEEEKERLRRQRDEWKRLREEAAKLEKEAEARRVAIIESLIGDEALSPDLRAKLILILKDRYHNYPINLSY